MDSDSSGEGRAPTQQQQHRSRLEVNFRRLLTRCEELAAEKESSQGEEWRLDKYVTSLEDMLSDLQRSPNPPKRDTVIEYGRKITFLKGILATAKLPTAAERVVAAQILTPVPSAVPETATKELHHRTTVRAEKNLREELLGPENEDGVLRQRRPDGNSGGVEDMDALMRYHQAMQEKIADHMLSLTRNLKEQSRVAQGIVQGDTKVLEQSSALADANSGRLQVESERLQEHNRRACRCWLWMVLVIVTSTFIAMVLFMKQFRKK